MGLPIIGERTLLSSEDRAEVGLVIGIGGTGTGETAGLRQRIASRLRAEGWAVRGVRHPSVIVSASANVADDAQLMARAVIQPMAQIGEGAIINTAAVIEHDARVGAYSHVSIGAILCGEVGIGARAHIGAGAVVRQGITLGDDVIVGAGAVVVRNQQGPAVLIGVPARQMDGQ
jgi:sugar O-acyltransferase (sialic acid O-acetyltransferase NeuD family)